jgi:hypothetical protein
MFLGAAPPASAIEEWVLGLARPAYVYLSGGPLPGDDGKVHGSVRESPLCSFAIAPAHPGRLCDHPVSNRLRNEVMFGPL